MAGKTKRGCSRIDSIRSEMMGKAKLVRSARTRGAASRVRTSACPVTSQAL